MVLRADFNFSRDFIDSGAHEPHIHGGNPSGRMCVEGSGQISVGRRINSSMEVGGGG